MTVQAEVVYSTTFSCNEPKCGLSQKFALGKVQATAKAKEVGWTIARNNHHYCPAHPRARGRRPSEEKS